LTKKREALASAFTLSLTKDDLQVAGEPAVSILGAVKKYGSISKAAREIGISYKYAWDTLADVERAIGQPILRKK
jgi:molybdate transport system regulatory protein